MQLLPISNNANVSLRSTDVRNVCNATLSLLFTLALFIWGLLVNRKQAWRTDGGTAAFGCAALSLAVVKHGAQLPLRPQRRGVCLAALAHVGRRAVAKLPQLVVVGRRRQRPRSLRRLRRGGETPARGEAGNARRRRRASAARRLK